MRIYGYIRVSTESQESNQSLDVQRRQISEWAASRGHELVKIYSDTASGTEKDRPGLKSLFRAIKSVDAMAIVRVDRLARDTMLALTLLDKLDRLTRRLEVIELPVDMATPTGRFVYTQMAALAQMERHLILLRTAQGRAEKEKKGGYAYGAPAFGWMSRKGEILPDIMEREVINMIKKLHNAGCSLREIARRLTSLKMPTKRGGEWHPSIVSKILKRLGLQ